MSIVVVGLGSKSEKREQLQDEAVSLFLFERPKDGTLKTDMRVWNGLNYGFDCPTAALLLYDT